MIAPPPPPSPPAHVVQAGRDLFVSFTAALRPPPDLTPSQFATAHRVLHPDYCPESPGPWDNDKFPAQVGIMDTAAEAIRTGRPLVHMKAAQSGGTDSAINVITWIKVYYPGPQLFLTSTEKVARTFGRQRFSKIIRDCPPLNPKRIPGERETALNKRFSDGDIDLCGGQSVHNLQSTPYRVVTIDELDSLVENLGGQGDPIALAEARTFSFGGPTLIFAYAHPSSPDRGSARLFYKFSDQRRGFVVHPSCGKDFYFKWEHIKCTPREGQTPAEAERDPDCYAYYCPHCGELITDAQRVAMMRAGITYKSELAPEEAAKRTWIGVSSSQAYTPAKSVRFFAEAWIKTDCGRDENATRVFWNKIWGEPYEPKVQSVDLDALRKLIVVSRRPKDPEHYFRGSVPPAVQFLTAGQDSRATELHWSVWGWGVRTHGQGGQGIQTLCGWLIDWGVIKRAYSLTFSEAEYTVFDGLYRRLYPCTVGDKSFHVRACGHDVGYEPTQLPILRFCRRWPGRAIPVRGASLTNSSAINAPYARWGNAIKFKAGENELADVAGQQLIINTYQLKTEWYAWAQPDRRIKIPDVHEGGVIGMREVPLITFPEDVDDDFLQQCKNEVLMKGKRRNELVWGKTGPNHFADTNTYAHGLAMNFDPFLPAPQEGPARRARPMPRTRGPGHDPSMG